MAADSTEFPPLVERAWFLTGPTASGKSSVGTCLAERIDAEILSLDSMAVYCHMDLGTAKPSAGQQQRVPHHLLDLTEPDAEFSVSQYLGVAHKTTNEVVSRGKRAMFVGGTPMYLKGCLRGFDAGPPADWEFRKAIEAEIEEHGMEALRRRLEQVDPLSAHQLHANDRRRIIRALEVAKATGQPLSHRQTQFESRRSSGSVNAYVLRWPRAELHRRIDRRVDQMFTDGLVDEVAKLLKEFETLSRTALQAVGYKEVVAHLQGHFDLAETIEQVKAHTRQLARRQETWFRSMAELRFVDMNEDRDPSEVAEQIIQISESDSDA